MLSGGAAAAPLQKAVSSAPAVLPLGCAPATPTLKSSTQPQRGTATSDTCYLPASSYPDKVKEADATAKAQRLRKRDEIAVASGALVQL